MPRFSDLWPRVGLVPLFLRARARAARREGRFGEAAVLYEELARLRPGDAPLRVQCGHMRKEAGDLVRAEAHYHHAERHLPNDPEVAVQLGHLLKVAGTTEEAEVAYNRALALRPGWDAPERELARLRANRSRPGSEEGSTPEASGLVPELAPGGLGPRPMVPEAGVHISRLGRREPGEGGLLTTLRGVEAVRGFCLSRVPVTDMHLLLDAIPVHRVSPKGGYPVAATGDEPALQKYVCNLWLDFGRFARGRYALELRFTDAEGTTHSFHDTVRIDEPLDPAAYPLSDGIIALSEPDPARLAERIRALPSVVRPARRTLFPDGVRSILVMRTDQLGDLVASIPALRRLRALVPAARIVGLLTAANADLARTLGLFDEVIVVNFPDDPVEQRRLMPLPAQEALRQRLSPYRFDVAIDLSQSDVSRELLRLSGARFTHGFGSGDHWPWMTSEAVADTHDLWNRHSTTPHAAKVLGLVEALGAALGGPAPLIRRDDLPRDRLASLGLVPERRFAVLHAGARIAFSRWPGFPELAERLIERTDLQVVLVSEEPGYAERVPAALRERERFHLLDRRLPFDDFDALLSHAAVVVGNDSGPKHLAALRGTPVVTLFTARINWAEWAQEEVGTVITRRVPCQGCAILHHAEECGQDFTCIRGIRVEEVFDAVMAQLGRQ